MRLCLTYGSFSFPFIILKNFSAFPVKACNQWQQGKHYLFRQDDVYGNGSPVAPVGLSSALGQGLAAVAELRLRVPPVLSCDSVVMSIRRIMHWARRIEQEIDRVFQHITGAQQLKGVSKCVSVCLYSTQVLLITVCCVNSICSGSVAGCKTSHPPRLGVRMQRQTVPVFFNFSHTRVEPRTGNTMFPLSPPQTLLKLE